MSYEVEHDTKLLALLRELTQATGRAAVAADALKSAATTVRVSHTGEAMIFNGRMYERAKLNTLPAGTLYHQAKTFQRGEEGFYVRTDGEYPFRRRATMEDFFKAIDPEHATVTRYQAAKNAEAMAAHAIVEHEKHYTGWSRFFLVVSSSGHVHSGMNCSTCYATTLYAPVVELSGKTEEDAHAIVGDTLCSVCFPTSTGKGKLTKAQANKLVSI